MSATQCDIHGLNWKVVPAGYSKAKQKNYDAFLSCPDRNCKEKPPKGTPVPGGAPKTSAAPSPELDKKLDKIIGLLESLITKLDA